MPPNPRFTREDLVMAAFSLVRVSGVGALTARNLAAELGASTCPIYSLIDSIDALKPLIVVKAFDLLSECERRPVTGNPGLDRSLGYVLFARNEKALWRMLCDPENRCIVQEGMDERIAAIKETIRKSWPELLEDQVEEYFFMSWVWLHGMAHMLNNYDSPESPMFASEQEILECLSRGMKAIQNGYLQLASERKSS